jgi:hypothetical protein
MRPCVIGEPNLPRHWLRTCVGDEKAKSAEAGWLDDLDRTAEKFA